MKLVDLFDKNDVLEIFGEIDTEISHITDNTNNIKKGSIFFAKIGSSFDSHALIDEAIQKGALAIICETLPSFFVQNICYIKVKKASIAIAKAAKIFYENPSQQIKLIAVTGTCGKTSTVYILYQIFKKLGYKVGLLSSIENKINDKSSKSDLTTPGSIEINCFLKQMVDEGCEYCFMEASSHAIEQDRIHGLNFTGAIFTNISHEHLDYHKTFNNYIYAKKKLFDNLSKNAFALVNIDDRHASIMLQNCAAKKYSFAAHSIADYRCRIISNSLEGLELEINGQSLWIPLRGKFNAYNSLAAYAVADILEQDPQDILIALSSIETIPGRFQIYKNKQGTIGIIDHAHKPEALQNLLASVNSLCFDNQKIITIIGCGGNRDKTKRPIMGKIAAEYSDMAILTSDNPRFENPEDIIAEMYAGIPQHLLNKVDKIIDRKNAIKQACSVAKKDDIIVMAGKGDEKYTIIKDQKIPLDELEIFINS